jgi:hypothetical protein
MSSHPDTRDTEAMNSSNGHREAAEGEEAAAEEAAEAEEEGEEDDEEDVEEAAGVEVDRRSG